jgi:hypothetical protein
MDSDAISAVSFSGRPISCSTCESRHDARRERSRLDEHELLRARQATEQRQPVAEGATPTSGAAGAPREERPRPRGARRRTRPGRPVPSPGPRDSRPSRCQSSRWPRTGASAAAIRSSRSSPPRCAAANRPRSSPRAGPWPQGGRAEQGAPPASASASPRRNRAGPDAASRPSPRSDRTGARKPSSAKYGPGQRACRASPLLSGPSPPNAQAVLGRGSPARRCSTSRASSPAQLERDRAEHQGRSDKRAGPERLVEHGRARHGADKRCDVGVGTDQRRRRAGQ